MGPWERGRLASLLGMCRFEEGRTTRGRESRAMLGIYLLVMYLWRPTLILLRSSWSSCGPNMVVFKLKTSVAAISYMLVLGRYWELLVLIFILKG